jgi:hypothetical protein
MGVERMIGQAIVVASLDLTRQTFISNNLGSVSFFLLTGRAVGLDLGDV